MLRSKAKIYINERYHEILNRILRLLECGDSGQAPQRHKDILAQLGEQSHQDQEDSPNELTEQAQQQEQCPPRLGRDWLQDQEYYPAKLEQALRSLKNILDDFTYWSHGDSSQRKRDELRAYQARLRDKLAASKSAEEALSKKAIPTMTPAEDSTFQAVLDELTYVRVTREQIEAWDDKEKRYEFSSEGHVYEAGKNCDLPRLARGGSDYSVRDQIHDPQYSQPGRGSRGNTTVDNLVASVKDVWTRLGLSR